MYGPGISTEGDVLDLAVEHKIVQKSGAWFSYGDQRLGQGRENVRQFLRDNPELAQQLRREVIQAVNPEWIAGLRRPGRPGPSERPRGPPAAERRPAESSRACRRRERRAGALSVTASSPPWSRAEARPTGWECHLDGRFAFDLAARGRRSRRAARRRPPSVPKRSMQLRRGKTRPTGRGTRALARPWGCRDRSRREVERRLRQSGLRARRDGGDSRLATSLGYLDDRRFAAAYAAEKQRGGWGAAPHQSGVWRARGSSGAVIDEVLLVRRQSRCATAGQAAEPARADCASAVRGAVRR